jgi:DNA-binding NarL/FixJ family response regulator
MKPKIVIVEEQERVGKSLTSLLSATPGVEVIGECEDLRELPEKIKRLQPNVVVLDLIPGVDGVRVVRQIRSLNQSTRVIVLVGSNDKATMKKMLAAGAAGYIVKSVRPADVIRAIREGTPAKAYLSIDCSFIGPSLAPPVPQRPLTSREIQVLSLIVAGKSNKQVAKILDIGEATVKDHRRHIKEKLGINDIATLTRYAISIGLI